MRKSPKLSQLPDKERYVKSVRPRKKECVNIPILGHRDPRGHDNNVRVWVDETDRLHIRIEKTNRCYQDALANYQPKGKRT